MTGKRPTPRKTDCTVNTVLTCGLLIQASLLMGVSAADWCYQVELTCNASCTGPEGWRQVHPNCGGASQSPINIVTKRALPDQRLTAFHFTGYQKKFHARLTNNGHTVQVDLPAGIRMGGANLPAAYQAVQLHLHWGDDGGPGSEHTIDGEHFPMEMHIVHIKEGFHSLSQAVTDPTGVAVLGFFFKESSSTNRRYEPFINALKLIERPHSSTTVRRLSLDLMVPPQPDLAKYYRYHGSLTTPACSQAVLWTLFESAIPLSRQQMMAFTQLCFASGRPMVLNYRPAQSLNARSVLVSMGHVTPASVSPPLTSALVALLAASRWTAH